MATLLYIDGKLERIEAHLVDQCLANGYFTTREESLGESPIDELTEEEAEQETIDAQAEQADEVTAAAEDYVAPPAAEEDQGELGDADDANEVVAEAIYGGNQAEAEVETVTPGDVGSLDDLLTDPVIE